MDSLLELARTIHSDFEWCMKTELIFENEGKIKDPETLGFLKGVEYCTVKYLDILERDAKTPDNIEAEVTYVDISKVNEEEVE